MKKKIDNRVAVVIITAVLLLCVGYLFWHSHVKDDPTSVGVLQVESDSFYEGQPSIGDPGAPVRVVEFGDFKCPACKAWKENVYPRLKSEYIDTGKVQLYFVNYAFLGTDSLYAAEIGEAIAAQSPDLFFRYYELLYANQKDEEEEWATEEFILPLVEENLPEINMESLKEDLEKGAYKGQVDKDVQFAKNIGLNSVPVVFVNGRKVENAFDFEAMKKLIEESLQ